jgi:hypothetical protein
VDADPETDDVAAALAVRAMVAAGCALCAGSSAMAKRCCCSAVNVPLSLAYIGTVCGWVAVPDPPIDPPTPPPPPAFLLLLLLREGASAG